MALGNLLMEVGMSNWNNLEYEVQQRTEPDASIYKVSGVITDTHEAFQLLEKVREGIQKGPACHILDLTDVPHITSAGVGIIAAAYTSAKGKDKRLVLVGANSRIEQIVKVVGLWSMIEHFDSIAEALQA